MMYTGNPYAMGTKQLSPGTRGIMQGMGLGGMMGGSGGGMTGGTRVIPQSQGPINPMSGGGTGQAMSAPQQQSGYSGPDVNTLAAIAKKMGTASPEAGAQEQAAPAQPAQGQGQPGALPSLELDPNLMQNMLKGGGTPMWAQALPGLNP